MYNVQAVCGIKCQASYTNNNNVLTAEKKITMAIIQREMANEKRKKTATRRRQSWEQTQVTTTRLYAIHHGWEWYEQQTHVYKKK